MKSWANTQRNSPGALPPMHPKRRGIFLAFFGRHDGASREDFVELTAPTPPDAGAPSHAPGNFAGTGVPAPPMRALRPAPRGILQGRGSLRPTICEGAKPPLHSPMWGSSAPPPRVTFSPMRKSPKNLQGLRPLEPAGAKSPPFSRLLRSAPARAGLVSATDAAGFATLRWWANRSCCFLWLHRGNTLCC